MGLAVSVCAGVAVLALSACTHAGPGASPGRTAEQHSGIPTARPSTRAPSTPPPSRRLRVATAGFRLPVALGREAVVSSACTALVAGGLVGGGSSTATAYAVDLRRGRVTSLPDLPVPVHDTAGGLPGRPLVIGGGNAAEQGVVQRWNGMGWNVVGRLPQPRSDLVAATVGSQLVVAGGYNGKRPAEPDVLSSTDGRAWKTIAVLPVPVRYPASAVAQGAIWVFGGESSGVLKTAIQRIDPATGRASIVSRLPLPVGHGVAIPFGARILLAGGRTDAHTVTDHMWWFDPHSGSVTKAGRLPSPLADSAVARCGDTYYLVGGETPAVTDRVLEVTYR
jgi:N-acetylneuraminic acid mutarotase